jgi:hypothetical protein
MAWEQFGSLAKQVGVSIIAAALGFGGKAAIESVNNSHELENDKALIAKLFNLQEKTQTDVQTLVVNETRLEGKVDVLGQKVDDLPQRAADATRHSK